MVMVIPKLVSLFVVTAGTDLGYHVVAAQQCANQWSTFCLYLKSVTVVLPSTSAITNP